jgi:serpin B
MAATQTTSYAVGKDYRAVELAYSGNFAMTVIVPTNMASFLRTLDAAKFNAVTTAERPYEVDLTLPRFSIDSRFELADALSAMGMPTAFGDRADLSGITKEQRLYIDRVAHEANIDVVEDGTTAAAVTVAIGSTTGGGDPPVFPHVQFHVDHPFLYFIREYRSGAILFMGVVADPSAK